MLRVLEGKKVRSGRVRVEIVEWRRWILCCSDREHVKENCCL